ncbi:Twin-arginine translocation protein TatA [Methanosarcina horonobensis HB-1 = JCM 15518]|uniref:Twin-arginine translocation protein TatA n=1 Tax=Methanosarcina horonobensis HB-1 = JCM 15518 TaxID=1434110 RepID=A0A0E3SGF1_9EURY|nr:twin-arginine translocase TatA/TatE family subunit [Methanosarcina horonobensis]AKB78638.1 Twin-arginine translocation protein TatA [Methanosarcina horonobensis HB-1 = JCM 15518]
MIGTMELICICGIAALLFGATKLPEFARALGSSVGEFRKAKLEVDKEVKELENKQ